MSDRIDLQDIEVASPCPVKWSDMTGSDRVRACARCKLNVYDFAELSPDQIAALVRETEGRLCGVLRRRADGTMLVRDCPVGLRKVRVKLVTGLATAVGLMFSFFSFAMRSGGSESSSEVWPKAKALTTAQAIAAEEKMRQWPYVGAMIEWLDPKPMMPLPSHRMIAGNLGMRRTTTPTTPTSPTGASQ